MPTLVKTTTSQILGGRKFWDLENGFKVMAYESNNRCTLFVSGRGNGANVELISKYLETKSMKHELTSTIDSYAIIVSSDEKQVALSLIESWAW